MQREILVVGFGLAGACVALQARARGVAVRVVDKGGGSSLVAAGLINPVAGRNFEPPLDLDDYLGEARGFYQELEERSGRVFLHELPILRRWLGQDDRRKFEKKREKVADWIEAVSEEGVLWKGGGWLDTRVFLQVAREALGEACFLSREILPREKEAQGESASGLVEVRCTGARGLRAGEFEGREHRCAQGEILTLRVPGLREDRILNGGGWMIPIGDGLFRVGATYAWDELDRGATEEGRSRIEKIVRDLIGERAYEVVDHVAGVRPILHRSEPQVERDGQGRWLMNGLGSKGVIYAPRTARMLVEWIFGEARE